MYKIWSQYYVPRSRKELVEAILPSWKGSKTELRQYSRKRLLAVFHRMRQDTIVKLCGRGDKQF